MLADMGCRLALTPTQAICPKRRKLNDLAGRRDQVAMRTQEKTRINEANDDQLKQDLQDHIDWLTCRIESFDRQIKALIEDDRDLTGQADLMRSVPGVGPVTATTLLALMPARRQITPHRCRACRSTEFRPVPRHTAHPRGRRRVRKALYRLSCRGSRASRQSIGHDRGRETTKEGTHRNRQRSSAAQRTATIHATKNTVAARPGHGFRRL